MCIEALDTHHYLTMVDGKPVVNGTPVSELLDKILAETETK